MREQINAPRQEGVSFNIFGACVSRDLFPKDCPYEIRQYVSFSSPLSVYQNKGDRILTEEDLAGVEHGSAFSKRCLLLDHNKTGLAYLFQKPSDYLLVDFTDIRLPILCYGNNNYLTRTNLILNNREYFDRLFGSYRSHVVTKPEEALECVKWLGSQILMHYAPERIILNRYDMAEQYLATDGTLQSYSYIKHIRRVNGILKGMNDCFEEMCGGRCHVIEMPEGMIADEKHHWGNYPLHYVRDYYAYAYEALQHILSTQSAVPQAMREKCSVMVQLRVEQRRRKALLQQNKQLMTENKKLRSFAYTVKNLDDFEEEIQKQAADFCQKQKLHQVALWGNYLITPRLIRLLTQVGVETVYVITGKKCDLPVKAVSVKSKTFPPSDAIIVCDLLSFEKHADDLRQKTDIPVYHIGELIPIITEK